MTGRRALLCIISFFLTTLLISGAWIINSMTGDSFPRDLVQFLKKTPRPINYTKAEGRRHVVCYGSGEDNDNRRMGYSIEKLPALGPPDNAPWSSSLDMTSGKYSNFFIPNAKPSYDVCDQLIVAIEARDGRGELKRYGGDYFRAKIFTQTTNFTASAATDGEIVDLRNGTYAAYFTLKWAGPVTVRVTLIHPSEAVGVIRRFREAAPARYAYRGKFVSRDKAHREETFCNLALPPSKKEVCNFTDESSGSPWFCYRPGSAYLTCDDWVEHRCDTGTAKQLLVPELTELQKQTLTPKRDLSSTMGTVDVVDNVDVTPRLTVDDLPTCSPGNDVRKADRYGYYSDNVWISSHCKIAHFDLKDMRTCLANRKVYFLGDSTIRQLFEFYLKSMAPDLRKNSSDWEPKWHVGPTHAVDTERNTSMTYRFHGIPIGRNAWALMKDVDYIANVIDTINNGGSDQTNAQTTVVISLWAHFTQQPEHFYAQRVRVIMNAIARLRARSPLTLVVFKSANTREFYDITQRIYHSDWFARRLDQILRGKALRDQNVAFIDAWDMSSAQLVEDNVHPGGPHVENLSNQLLTLMCRQDGLSITRHR